MDLRPRTSYQFQRNWKELICVQKINIRKMVHQKVKIANLECRPRLLPKNNSKQNKYNMLFERCLIMGSKVPQPSPNSPKPCAPGAGSSHIQGGHTGSPPGETAERRAVPAPPPPPKKD